MPELPVDTSKSSGNLQYVVAIVIMCIIGVMAILTVTYLRPQVDNSVLIGLIIAFISPTTISLLALMKSQETHLMINSRMSQWFESGNRAATLLGEKTGRLEAEGRADAMAVVKSEETKVAEPEVINVKVLELPDGKLPDGKKK